MFEKNDLVFEWIRTYMLRNHYAPHIRDIAEAFDISISTAHRHVKKLEERGRLRTEPWKERSIKILDWS